MEQHAKSAAFLSQAEFEDIFGSVCNWERWGPADAKGTLNYITPKHVCAAAALFRSGRALSLSLPINTVAAPDNSRPSLHHMVNSACCLHPGNVEVEATAEEIGAVTAAEMVEYQTPPTTIRPSA